MNNLLIKLLEEALKLAKEDKCTLTNEQEDLIISMLAHKPLNKEQASLFLNISRATFDREIRAGRFPKGRKIAGSSQLYWYKDELMKLSK